MTTFDLVEVRDYAASLHARMHSCESGEGTQCASLDDTMRYYARLCCELREKVRHWGREVFAGHVAFDPDVEEIWLSEIIRLHEASVEALAYGEPAEKECFMLEGAQALRAALWDLEKLVANWRAPKLAVGPGARIGLPLSPAAADVVRRRIERLPPLPATWQPVDEGQKSTFTKLRRGRKPL